MPRRVLLFLSVVALLVVAAPASARVHARDHGIGAREWDLKPLGAHAHRVAAPSRRHRGDASLTPTPCPPTSPMIASATRAFSAVCMSGTRRTTTPSRSPQFNSTATPHLRQRNSDLGHHRTAVARPGRREQPDGEGSENSSEPLLREDRPPPRSKPGRRNRQLECGAPTARTPPPVRSSSTTTSEVRSMSSQSKGVLMHDSLRPGDRTPAEPSAVPYEPPALQVLGSVEESPRGRRPTPSTTA